jgi:hypothetical protein
LESRQGQKDFPPDTSRPALERSVHHSSPSSAEVKNEWSSTSAPPVCLKGFDRDNVFLLLFVCCITDITSSGIVSEEGSYQILKLGS